MKIRFWGTRGSIAAPGPDTASYGGNTSCVEVRGDQGSVLILDAGTGIRALGSTLFGKISRVDILLSHLHMDHIQGLGFFGPLYDPSIEVHIWGPASATLSLKHRLIRYLAPPLFPVPLRDLPCELHLHHVPVEAQIQEFTVRADRICHPGPTVGYRIEGGGRKLAYMPDHEPALGADSFPGAPEWTSGFELAQGVDVLIHDAQYTDETYAPRVGWGHSTIDHAIDFARMAGVKHLVPFHHDPAATDLDIDRVMADAIDRHHPPFGLTAAREGTEMVI